jgi:2-polyprenyl-6-methoxyphenol hydroxylase-like FAD-dependent oxidoreductase
MDPVVDRDASDAASTAATQVLVVGAGPTGLVLALWLTELGVAVRIIDRAAEPGTTSRAVGVTARTLELYRQVGLAAALVAGGVKVPAVNLWVKGTRAARLPFERMGTGLTPYPYVLVFPQDEHERLLIARLGALGVAVERRTELARFDQRGDGVRAVLRRGDGAEETCNAPYLAACDGARSTVREALATGFPGGTYAEVFYVADVDSEGPAANGEIHVDLDQADFLAVFPLKPAGRVRLIGSVLEADGGPGSFTFQDVRERASQHMKFTFKHLNWFSTYRVHHRVAARFREGRVFLLGDAAHIHSPVGGQGMNTGIGDAVNLAWKLAAVLKGGAGEGVLDSYEPERIAFARKLVATTDRIFTLVTRPGAVARLVRTRVAPRLAPLSLRLKAVRRFIFLTVSQLAVEYRESPLSEGEAGDVRGGDRLPWVEMDGDGSPDNFAPLTSLSWQAHVYGEAGGGVAEACAELGLPLHRFAWTPAMRRRGLSRGATYLVRPDGYVALADADGDPERLRRFCAEHDAVGAPGRGHPAARVR